MKNKLNEALKINPGRLLLSYEGIDHNGAIEIAEVLKTNSALTGLNLNSNDIGDQGAIGIAEALKINSALTELSLALSNIGAIGAIGIAEVLKINSTLTELNLTSNNIGDQGAIEIAEALKINSALTELSLAFSNIGAIGAIGIAEVLKINSTLTELDLTANNIGDQGAIEIAEALKTNSTLTKLDLTSNKIGDQGAIGIADDLKINSALTGLNLNINDIGDQGAIGIAEALKNNFSITCLDMGIGMPHRSENSIIVESLSRNKQYSYSLVKFLCDNKEEFAKAYNGDIHNLKVSTLAYPPDNSKFPFPKGVYSFLNLLLKASGSISDKDVKIIADNAKCLMAANFFKAVCKGFDSSHELSDIPKELTVKITYGLPFPSWKYEENRESKEINTADGFPGYEYAQELSLMIMEDIDMIGEVNITK